MTYSGFGMGTVNFNMDDVLFMSASYVTVRHHVQREREIFVATSYKSKGRGREEWLDLVLDSSMSTSQQQHHVQRFDDALKDDEGIKSDDSQPLIVERTKWE